MNKEIHENLRIYLRILAITYSVGALTHLADLVDLRLKFSAMGPVWKAWIVYLLIFDVMAAAGLWKLKKWGEHVFLFIAVSQLVAYLLFPRVFGQQWFLIGFHFVTITTYFSLGRIFDKRTSWVVTSGGR